MKQHCSKLPLVSGTPPLFPALALVMALLGGCTDKESVDEVNAGDDRATRGEPESAEHGDSTSDAGETLSVSSADAAADPTVPSATASSAVPLPSAMPLAPASEPEPVAPIAPVEVERPPNEPSAVYNRGVWISAGVIAHGTGYEWEYYYLPQSTPGSSWGRPVFWGTTDDDVWVVGALAARFDGTRLSFSSEQSESPWGDLTGINAGSLYTDIWGTSSSDVWAVAYGDPFNILPLAHFDGTAWSVVESPAEDLGGVWTSTPGEVWASGRSGLYRYDGASWTLDSEPTRRSAWGTGPNDIWAGLRWHYDGQEWIHYDLPGLENYEGGRFWKGTSSLFALAKDSPATPAVPDAAIYGFEPTAGSWERRVEIEVDDDVRLVDVLGRNERDIWSVASGAMTLPGGGGTPGIRYAGRVYHYDGAEWADVTPPLLSNLNITRLWIAPGSESTSE